MKSKSNLVLGTTRYVSKNPYGPESVSLIADAKVWKDEVKNVLSVVGDRKKPNPHKYEIVKVKYLNGAVKFVNATNSGYYGSYTGPLIAYGWDHSAYFSLEAFPSNTYNNALSKLYEELRGSVDLSIDIAQRGQTAKLIKDIAKVETYTSSFRSLKALVKGVAAARLAYVYGIKPTLSTIYETVEKLHDEVDPGLLNIKVRVKEPLSWKSKEVNLFDYMPTSYADPAFIVSVVEGAHMCELKCRYKPRGNSWAGFTSLNPVSIAWELLPYSFVVDWFFNVGSYVRNLETALLYGGDFVDGYMTKVSYAQMKMIPKRYSYQKGSGSGLNNCTFDAKSEAYLVNFDRSILTSSPTPEIPSFRADLGSARLLNAAALLAVLLKK